MLRHALVVASWLKRWSACWQQRNNRNENVHIHNHGQLQCWNLVGTAHNLTTIVIVIFFKSRSFIGHEMQLAKHGIEAGRCSSNSQLTRIAVIIISSSTYRQLKEKLLLVVVRSLTSGTLSSVLQTFKYKARHRSVTAPTLGKSELPIAL